MPLERLPPIVTVDVLPAHIVVPTTVRPVVIGLGFTVILLVAVEELKHEVELYATEFIVIDVVPAFVSVVDENVPVPLVIETPVAVNVPEFAPPNV